VKSIQTPQNGRIPEPDEKPFRDSMGVTTNSSFTQLGRFWFVDVWANYPSYGERRHIGLFNVENSEYLDLKDREDIIGKINTGQTIVTANAGRSDFPLRTALGLFRF
jgi:hypothetical protein